MNRIRKISLIFVFGLFFLGRAEADPPKIDLPSQPAEPAPAVSAASSEESMSTSEPDPTNHAWKDYQNKVVRVRLRVKAAWTITEYKDSNKTGSAGFTVSRQPGPVTFVVLRERLDRPFEEWVSSASLSQLYPTGFKHSKGEIGGRTAVKVQGSAKDGRREESYFLKDGEFIHQVTFSAPAEYWNDFQETFAAQRKDFRWLR